MSIGAAFPGRKVTSSTLPPIWRNVALRTDTTADAGQMSGPLRERTSMPNGAANPAIFHFVMIKPTHYDDDGYPIQWFRSAIPSNTLACLNALAEDAAKREVLGPGVDIRLHTYDETNRRVKPAQIIRMIKRAGGRAIFARRAISAFRFLPAKRKRGGSTRFCATHGTADWRRCTIT